MKAPRLIVVRNNVNTREKWRRYKEHCKLCERCREAITELDLCLEGLDLWLDDKGIKALQEFEGKLSS